MKTKNLLTLLAGFWTGLTSSGKTEIKPDPQSTTTASFYADKYVGRKTASGQLYSHGRFTCASWDYPFGTVLELTYTSQRGSLRHVLVEVNDRGPAREYYDKGRTLDLSLAAFRALENPHVGLIQVNVRVVSLGGAK